METFCQESVIIFHKTMPAGSSVWPTANDVQTWYMGKQKDHCWYRNRLKHQKCIDNWALGSNIALNELPITHNNRWGKNWTSNYSSWIESFIRNVVWFRIWSARLPFTHSAAASRLQTKPQTPSPLSLINSSLPAKVFQHKKVAKVLSPNPWSQRWRC